MPFVIGQAFSPEVLSLVRQTQEAEKNRALEAQRINLSAWEAQQRNSLAREQMRLERDQFGISAEDSDLRRQALQQQIESERLGQLRADEQLNLQRGAQGYDQDLAARRMDLSEKEYASGLDLSQQTFEQNRLAREENLSLSKAGDRREQEAHDFRQKTLNPVQLDYVKAQTKYQDALAQARPIETQARADLAKVSLAREKRLEKGMSVVDATKVVGLKLSAAKASVAAGDYGAAREIIEGVQDEIENLRQSGSMLPEQMMRTAEGSETMTEMLLLGGELKAEPREGSGNFDDLLSRLRQRFSMPTKDPNPPTGR